MVMDGPLSRYQFERLESALVEQGYLIPTQGRGHTFELSDKGWMLLQAIKEDQL